MGVVRQFLTNAVEFVREEVLPVRYELQKAGLLNPPGNQAYDPKASLIDPFNYQASVYGYKEKYTFIDYQKAKQISYADPIISAIIQTRTNQVGAFAVAQKDRYKVGFKVSLRDKAKKGSKSADKRTDELQKFINSCGYEDTFEDTPDRKRRDSFETFLRKIARDSLTYDQVNFEVVPRKNGIPSEFIAVDASTIRLMPDKQEQSMLWGQGGQFPNNNLDAMAVRPYWNYENQNVTEVKSPKYVQVINGTPRAWFDEGEMSFGLRNPRTDIFANGYGFSEIEMLLTTITAHINADTYNRRFFSQGSSTKGILAFEGHVPPDQLESFRRQWHQQISGVQNAWKTPIVATGEKSKLNWVSLHSTNREMEWGKYIEYLVKTICGVYQIDPIEIGFDISKNGSSQSGGGSSLGGQGQQVERLKWSKDRGLDPLLRFLANLINEHIIWRIDPDFEFEFIGLNSSTEKEQVELDKLKIETFQTVNELRAEHDLPKLKEEVESPGDLIMNPQFIQAWQGLQQQSQMDQGMGGGDQGMGGGDQGGQQGQDEQMQPLSGDEPNYENMSTEDLEAELSKLTGGAKKSIDSRKRELEIIL